MMNKMVFVVTEAVLIIFPRWQVSLIPEKHVFPRVRVSLISAGRMIEYQGIYSILYAKLQYIGIDAKIFQAIQTI